MLTPLMGAFVMGPMCAHLKLTSQFQYLKLRYNSNFVRLTATTLYLIRAFIATAIIIYGPATTVTALSSINTSLAIVVIGSVTTFYTCIGGIKAVIWTG
jgi:Na+/proline symporter